MHTRALTCLLAMACTGDAPDEPATATAPPAEAAPTPPSDPAVADVAALARAQDGTRILGKQLKTRLVGALEAGGPAAAATVCADEAQGIGALAGAEAGAKVGRASLRTRRAHNTGPDWVAAWLQEQGERPAEGVVGISEVVEVDGKRVARVLEPIPVGPVCVTCHGPKESLAPEVVAVLGARYPDDMATGYAVGDLRGAIWAESAVKAP